MKWKKNNQEEQQCSQAKSHSC